MVSNGGTQFVFGGSSFATTVVSGGSQYVSSGGTASSTTVGTGGNQYVSSGGVAAGTLIDGGFQTLFSGGAASGTVVGSAGVQNVSAGGIAVSAEVGSGGLQAVWAGGVASATTLDTGANQNVQSGGAVVGTVVDGGFQSVFAGGAASVTTINSGQQNVWTGGVASGTAVSSGGQQFLFGGTAIATTVTSGGAQYVSSGGAASATTLGIGADQYVSSGGTAFGTMVDGGNQRVFSGGAASGTVVGSGGAQIVAGGTAFATSVGSGGTQYLSAGATASATTIGNGANQIVSGGGLAIATTVSSGGAQTAGNGGVVSSTVVWNGGAQNVAPGGVAIGTMVSSGGTQAVSTGGITQATIVRQGGTVANNGTVIFNSADTATFDGTITGSGTVLQQGAGTTVLTGDNHLFGGSTTVTSGTLVVGEHGQSSASLGGNVAVAAAGTLRGHGSIGGNVANAGTVMPGGTIGTLTVDGNYAQSANGALVIEVSPTAGSQLRVNGAATLGGALQVLYDPGSYSARSYAILTANAISGQFSALSSTVSTGAHLNGLSQSVNYGATEVDLLLVQGTTTIAPLDTSIYTALGSTAAVGAQAFDVALLDHLVTASTAFTPPTTARTGGHDATWATLTQGYVRADGSGAASAFGAHRYGFAAGFDHPIDDRTLVGGAIGYEHDEIGESTTPDTGKLDAIRLAAYGRHRLGPIEASAVFGYGSDWGSEKRPFGAGPNSTPEGSDWLQELSGTAQAGLPLELSSNTVLEPRAGLHWAWLHGQSFAESGGGGQNLSVGADTAHSAQPYLGLTLMHALGTAHEPVNVHVDLDYARELAGRQRAVTVFSEDGTAFAAPGAPLAREIVSLGAGVRARIGSSWSVSGDASTRFREGSTVHLQLSYRF